MGTQTYQTTNEALGVVTAQIIELIGWADADAEHARENEAPDTARDDFRRATDLRKALKLLEGCER